MNAENTAKFEVTRWQTLYTNPSLLKLLREWSAGSSMYHDVVLCSDLCCSSDGITDLSARY
ncbi:rCG28159 [Rattus norvegicus]|uniref:RCG28159 n=1 Tax=Rattus norvegicus TaxID=10116 RepID=A6IE18_RAT|nr:rCG28159 [Rattus norvegicus]